jgi:hypothetical protein
MRSVVVKPSKKRHVLLAEKISQSLPARSWFRCPLSVRFSSSACGRPLRWRRPSQATRSPPGC